MPKFFTEPENVKENELTISSGDVRHITKVLRLKEGDVITVCDGAGFDYKAKICEISSDAVRCKITEKTRCDAEPDIRVTLFQGIPKAGKMDYIIQKTTELGISRIVPVMLERCVSKVENKKAGEKKRERWQKIAESAAKQSGRGIIPEVSEPVTLEEAIRELKTLDVFFAPYECEETTRLRGILTQNKNVRTAGFMIGPEGGFDMSETDRLRSEGIPTVTLGKRILRTETAGEAVLAMLMYEIGDIND